MDKSLFAIFKTFFKIGTLLLGGGYVILPLLQSEVCEKKGWVASEELCEYYALSTSLPGIIAVNTAIFTGKKIAGMKGAFCALCGMVLPAFIAIILLASVLAEISGFGFIKNIFWGVSIGVITLLFLAVKEMFPKCVKDKFSSLVFAMGLMLSLIGVSPVWVVIFGIIVGLIYGRRIKCEQ